MKTRSRATRSRGILVVLAMLIIGTAGCSSDADADAKKTSSKDGTAAAFPRTVTNCGKEVTIPAEPQKIVGIEGAAETVMALGAGDRLVGWFGNEADALPDELRTEAEKSKHLGGSFPSPQLEDVIAPEPDLVVLYGYSDEGGLSEKAFADLGVPTLVLSESCAKDADPTVEGYFGDVETIATALGVEDRGTKLIEGWRTEIEAATKTPVASEQSIFINGNPEPQAPFVSGGGSLADDQIEIAGGTNAFGDTDDAFLEPSWEEVASRDPDIIVDGSGGLDKSTAALKKYLKGDAALSQMKAVRDDAFLTIEYYDNVPGPRVVDGIVKIADFLRR